MMIPIEFVAGMGVFLGCFARAILPFLKKKSAAVKAGESVKWEGRYIWTLIFDLVVALIVTMMILPTLEIPKESIFPAAFLAAWASQDIINKVAT